VSLLLGLFDRPADAGCLKALWKAPAIPDLTEPLVGMSETHRNVAFAAHGEPGHGRRAARAGRSPAAARIFCAGASRAASRGLARRPHVEPLLEQLDDAPAMGDGAYDRSHAISAPISRYANLRRAIWAISGVSYDRAHLRVDMRLVVQNDIQQ
jgi:hypothetical protein